MDRDAAMAVLLRLGWLSTTPPEFRMALLNQAQVIRLDRGEVLNTGWSAGSDLIGVAQGVVGLSMPACRTEGGMIHLGHPGTWLGFGEFGCAAMAVRARMSVTCLGLPGDRLQAILTRYPEGWSFMACLVRQTGEAMAGIVDDLLIRDSARRCAAVLYRLSGLGQAGVAGQVEVPVTQDELAAASNLARTTTGMILRQLEQDEIIARAYGGVVVKSPDRLGALVAGARPG